MFDEYDDNDLPTYDVEALEFDDYDASAWVDAMLADFSQHWNTAE